MKQLQRILHVDDVPSIRVVTRISLEKLGGYQVLSCASAEEALSQVGEFAPNLLLLDVMLPEVDGVTLLRQLATLVDLQQIPVVLLTGHLEPSRLAELESLGVRCVLQKPFNPLQLAARLKDIWEADQR